MREVYLDHQSTTPVLPEVWAAMQPYFAEAFGSPSSLHRHGLRARDALAKAREQVAALVHAESPEEIIFTSGATESANLAVKGVALASQRRGNHIVVSDIEHPAVLNSLEFLAQQGFTSTRVAVDAAGRVDPEAVRAAMTEQTILVCVHHVNHDLGTIEPVRRIAEIAAERGVAFFADAAASGGWLPIDVQAMGVPLLALSPHRFYGPKGVGVLYRSRRARLNSLIHGGVQECGKRAGTENVPAIVGAGAAAEVAARDLPDRMNRLAALQRRLWEGIRGRVCHLKLNGPAPGDERIPTNLNISFEFIEGEGLALLCDTQGLAIASGPSCVSKAARVPPVLAAIGLDAALAQGNVLLSLGRDTTSDDVDFAVETIARCVDKLRGLSPTWDDFQRGMIDSVTMPRKSAVTPTTGG
jgi:cysteine desulfurase